MNRRVFVYRTAAMLATPLVARAQESKAGKVYRIGYLSGNPREDTEKAIVAPESVSSVAIQSARRLADGANDQLTNATCRTVRVVVALRFMVMPAVPPKCSAPTMISPWIFVVFPGLPCRSSS